MAAGFLNAEETKKLAGVDHMTLAIDLLYKLSKSEASMEAMKAESLFSAEKSISLQFREPVSFINDKDKYATAYDRSYEGKGRWKTEQVSLSFSPYMPSSKNLMQAIGIFAEYQVKALALMREKDPEKTRG